ncbi:MAG: lycopene cyclase domain-containing protein [Candidatus Omnitrophota bacterium]|jgi:lycopene cyclase domain-containing protein
MSEYMAVLLISLSLPLLLSFWPPLKFYRRLSAFTAAIGATLLVFGGWDVLAAARGHWSFRREAVRPFRFLGLPLEEILFFVVIPFCCLFTWETLKYLERKFRKA